MGFDLEFLFSAQVADLILQGLAVTLRIAAASGIGALFLGVVLALGQLSHRQGLRLAARAYVVLFRNTPLLVVLFFFYFGLPFLISRDDAPFIYSARYEERVAIFVISLVVGAYVSEVIRGGIQSISVGQLEAALATGMTRRQAFVAVVFPQVLPIIAPGLTNEAITVIKDTAFAMVIGVSDLMSQAQQIEAVSFRGFEAMTAVSAIYMGLISVVYLAMMLVEQAFAPKRNVSRERNN